MIDLLIAALICVPANCAVMEAWHHGEIFAGLRARVEAKSGFLAELLSCPFCFSHWTPLPLLTLLLWHDFDVCRLAALIPLSFAVTRMSNILNDVLHSRCRTPRVDAGLQDEVNELNLVAQVKGDSDGHAGA